MHHHPAKARHQKAKVKLAAPLRRRDPDFAAERDHRDDAEIGRVEDMFMVPTENKLAGNRDRGREHQQENAIGSEQ